MSGRLKGKTAVVTAAGQGIGRAIAEAFIDQGAEVYASDLERDKLDGLGAKDLAGLDVTSTRAVDDYARGIGEIDVLVNVAGFVHHGTVLETSDDDMDFAWDLNVKSMHRTIRAFLPGMLARAQARSGSGSIINLASVASSIKAAPNRYVYASTKAAVIGLTKAVALDFISKGLRVNAICPGTVHSPSWEERVAALGEEMPGGAEAAKAQFVARQPMGRIGTPEEIAALAVYLGSDESGFSTGQALAIDGGWAL